MAPDVIVQDLLFAQSQEQVWKFLTLARLDPDLRRVPLVLCTAATQVVHDEKIAEQLDRLGVRVVLKPFDIGGRSLYLECHGEGSPTVILEAGYRDSARKWSDDLLQPDAPRTMGLAGVAQFTRVCAYDRPGTVASSGEDDFVSRSERHRPASHLHGGR